MSRRRNERLEGRRAAKAAFLGLLLLFSLGLQALHPLFSGCMCVAHPAEDGRSGPALDQDSADGTGVEWAACAVCALAQNPSPAQAEPLVLPGEAVLAVRLLGVERGSALARGPPSPWSSRAPPAA